MFSNRFISLSLKQVSHLLAGLLLRSDFLRQAR
jgi:hypothetical protein